jgi:rhamnogalacturonyl hydrolase YesR
MYNLNPEKKNLLAINTMMKQLQNQPRTIADKVFWHKAIYAYQVWLDGIFMGLPFRCLTASTQLKPKDANKIYDDAVNQFMQWVLTNGVKYNHEFGLLNLDNKVTQVQIDKVKTVFTAQK